MDGFLDFLQSIMVPDWNALISMLPLFLILGVVGPILSIMMLMQLWYLIHRRRGRVRRVEEEPTLAPLDAAGAAIYPPNVPFCEQHGVIYPTSARSCEIDRAELSVRCPVDQTTRAASQELCRVCGTRYVLGASQTGLTVRRQGSPPEGGAAVA
ncbi:MAG: hypothetical protein M3452_11415 [Chloroflexota bacterium]|nr:hypothetical protein [Chloroflexota bacterium]